MRLPIRTMLLFVLALATAAWAQDDPRLVELRFHRVHLRNGNVVDGQLVRQTAHEVVLRLPAGEISFKTDSVEFVEFIKLKSLNDRVVVLEKPAEKPKEYTSPRDTPAVRPPKASKIVLDRETALQVSEQLAKFAAADPEQKANILSKVIALGGQVPAYLASIADTFDRDQVPVVLNTLTATKDPALVPVIGGLLENQDPTIRVNATMALGSLGDASAVSYLTPLLKDTDASVRTAAVTALALLRSPEAFDPLLPVISDPDREVRTRAIGTLNDLATQHGRKRELGDALATALPNSRGEAQIDLIYALGRGGHQANWNALAPLLRDDSDTVRKAAAGALAELAVPESAGAIAAAAPIERNTSVQAVLAKAVQKVHVLAAAGTLIDWLEKGDPDSKAPVLQALTSLASQNMGTDINAWRAWWEKAQPR